MGILARSFLSVINVNDGQDGQPGAKGDRGISVIKTREQWFLSTSNTALSGTPGTETVDGKQIPVGTWTYTEPSAIPDGYYLWGRLENTMSEGDPQYSDAVYRSTISGLKSEVDKANLSITNKVWQTDLSTTYGIDKTTITDIRDRVTSTQATLDGITSQVLDIETTSDPTTGEVTYESKRISTVEQTADKIGWVIKDGSTSSSVQYTANALTAMANQIDLTGKVTFNSMDTSLKNRFATAESTAETALDRTNIALETIIGTQTSNTYYFTGTSQYITELTNGLSIMYLQPRSVGGSQVAATYRNISTGADVSTNGVVLNLTLADGTQTGNIPVWYQGVSRLTSHFGYGSSYRLTYYEDIVVGGSYRVTGWFVDAQYNTDTVDNRIVYFTGKTGAVGIWETSLFMRDGNGTYQNICTASDGTVTTASSGDGARTTATTKKANTNGFEVGSPIWHTTTSYNANTNITGVNVIYASRGNVFDSRYSFNTTLTAGSLTPYANLYLVGTINATDGLFYLDSTWWTQAATDPAKVYILVGGVYDSTKSYCRITLYEDNPWLVYKDGKLQDYTKVLANNAQADANTANNWINSNGTTVVNAADIVDSWKGEAVGSQTTINGGLIQTNTILAKHLATNAIMSENYSSGISGSEKTKPATQFSYTGSFLDLKDGNIYTPNFGVINTSWTGGPDIGAYFNGRVEANSGKFGNSSSYWNIETVYDYNMQPHASLVGTGDPYLQTGNWQVSTNAVATRKYTRTDATNGKADYYKDAGTNTYYDVGMKIPTVFTGYNRNDAVQDRFKKVFFYGRKYQGDTASQIDQAWTYFFMVDTDGNVYENGTKLSEKYASIDGVSGQYLPLSGGTVSGNLTVTGTLTATASAANKLITTKTIRTNLGSTSSVIYTGETNIEPGVTGTLGVGNGGTGQTTAQAAANAFINALSAGSETNVPVDNDYFISQYIGGGTQTTTYYRRRFSLIWDYINGKIQSTYDIPNTYRELTNNSFDTADITEAEIGDLLVTGSGRFSNGLYGNLTGNVTGNLTGTASRATADADGNSISSTYVKKAGDTLTGNLQYTMYNSTRTPFNIYGGDVNGQGIAIGGGAAVVIGSGESVANVINPNSTLLSPTTEQLWLTSDGLIKFYTNCDTIANRVGAILSNSLRFYPETGNTGSIGTSDNPWATVYATSLHGALTGNASTATALATGIDVQVGNKTISDWTGTGNLTFSLADIAPEASTSSKGWMSIADKSKLDSIQVTSGGGIVVNTIQGANGINASTDQTSGITTISHSNTQITAGTASGTNSSSNLAFGATVTLPSVTYDAFGHITAKGTTSFKLPAAPTTITGNAGSATAFNSARTIALTGETIGSASSTGVSGWSISTQNLGINAVKEDKTVANASNRATTINNNFHDGVLRYFIAGSSTQGRPTVGGTNADARILHMAWDQSGYDCQIALINNNRSPLLKLRGSNNNGEYGDWIDVLGANNYTDYTVTKDGTGATGTWGISISGSANSAVSDGNGNIIATTYATKADPTFTGVLTAEAVKATNYVSVNPSKAGTVGGLALYATTPTDYGIAMRGTTSQGVHGYVQGDWATYFAMNGNETTTPPRGWIFKNAQSGSGVASINCEGNMVLNGSITVGGNSANTSGCRMVYDDTVKCLNFVFA